MTSILKTSSIFLLFVTFAWRFNTGTPQNTDSDAEEEEMVLHGNLSALEVTTFLPTEDSLPNPILDENADYEKDVWWENSTKLTDYDDERKNDASPENSVDKDELEKVNYFLPDQPISDASLFTDFKRELLSSQAKPILLSIEPTTSSPQTVNTKTTSSPQTVNTKTTSSSQTVNTKTIRTACGFGDRKCNMLIEDLSSDFIPNTQIQSTALSSYDTSLMELSEEITSYDSKGLNDYLTPYPSNGVTAQTSDNLILEESMGRLKEEVVLQGLLNKSDKSKQVIKERENSSSLENEPVRTFIKITEITPSLPVKESILFWNTPQTEQVSASKILSSVSTPLSDLASTKPLDPSTTASYFPLKTNTYIFPEVEPKKEAESGPRLDLKTPFISESPLFRQFSTVSSEVEPKKEAESGTSYDLKTPLISESPLLRQLSSVSWHFSKPDMQSPSDKFSNKEMFSDIFPILTSSFSESSVATETDVILKPESSFFLTDQTSPSSLKSSVLSESTSVSSSQATRINLHTDITSTNVKTEAVPPPRLSNPGCSSLPVCVEVTLLETSWDHFCSQQQDFLEFLSKSLSHYTRPIHPYHIVLDTEVCTLAATLRSSQTTPDIAFAFYVTNESGEYEEPMTELCGVILRKWAPSAFKSSVIEVRMYSRESISTPMPIMPELNSGFVAAVSISAVAGVALCLLCILLVIMKKKLIQGRHSDTTTPTADAYSLDSLSFSASFRRRRTRRSARSYLNHAFNDQEIPSHPLNEKTLMNSLKSKDLLEEEFKRIPMKMPKLDSIPEGAHVKNRYSNILPKPETRVLLADPSGDPLKCYINANYVKGYAGKSAFYIACQAPLPEGIEDFWRMVWEQQCRVIVMLTMFEENGTSRCAVYFPQSTLISQQPYGDFQVSLLKKDVYEFYTLSTLRLMDLEKNLFRDVIHLWFTAWPDVGVPKDSSSLVTFVQQCRPLIKCNAGPTVVHCSTGTGRTGVFLALDICMREYDESRSIDILQCIAQLRRDRAGAVQNKDQYIIIHEAILEYISRMINQSQSVSG